MPRKYIPVAVKSDYFEHPYAVLDPVTKKFAPQTPMPVSKVCPFCKQEFTRRLQMTATHWRKQIFCDAKCQAGNVTTKVKIECETCKKENLVQPYKLQLSKWQFCDMKCRNEYPHFKNLDRLSVGFTSENVSGENNFNWKGGITPLMQQIRTLPLYKAWVLDVFQRDHFTCRDCGDRQGGNLTAHHLTAFYYIIQENEIDSTEKAQACESLWDVNNGVTLCHDCHADTPNFGFKATLNPIDRRDYL